MAKLKVRLNRSGVLALLRSREMEAVCQERANAALQVLGDGYAVSAFRGKNRVNVSIKAESNQARQENMKHNTILKALRS